MKKITITDGILTTEMVPQLNINKLKSCYVIEGEKNEGSYQESENEQLLNPILFLKSNLTDQDRKLNIAYELMDKSGRMDYDISIEAVKSNLGKGKGVKLYFLCPISGERASILYYCFLTEMYVHRNAYSQRIYYPTQVLSKIERIYKQSSMNTDKLYNHFWKMKKKTYQGKTTKKNKQIDVLITKRELIDWLILQRSEDFLNKHCLIN
jgi:hypothetical protein